MLPAVHCVSRELTIIDGTRFPIDGGDQLNAIDPGLGDAGMWNKRRPEPAPRGFASIRPLEVWAVEDR